jgi:hypothetical protein
MIVAQIATMMLAFSQVSGLADARRRGGQGRGRTADLPLFRLPVVSLPEQGLVGLLWAPTRYGLAPRTLSQAREAEPEVLANRHLWSTESARAASIEPGQ